MKKALLIVCILILVMAGTGWGAVWHVRPGGSDLDTGLSWDTAFQTIQKAVETAIEADEIWVAAATYRLNDYILVDVAVSIYGGFMGTETQREERDWTQNVTIVDGNNQVMCLYVQADARIDGFTIRRGYSTYFAGGLYNGASPVVANCTFIENGSRSGGGIYNGSDSSPTIINCRFLRNRATSNYGGAIRNSRRSVPTVLNCTFHGNTAKRAGGAIYNCDSSPTITNCSFYDNTADDSGGAIHNYFCSAPVMTNCIFWGNGAVRGPEIYDINRSSPSVTYSNIQGGYPGTGNISVDPGFADPDEGDFHLLADSPCIDTGTDDVPSLPPTDFEGDPRIAGAHADMGVDEFVEEEDALRAYVLYANDKVRLRQIAASEGNVGSNGWIKIARGACGTIQGNICALEGIKVRGSIRIDGDVFTNGEVRVSGRRWHADLEVTGAIYDSRAANKLSQIDLPEFDFCAGGQDIRVRKYRSFHLDPGSYGEVSVGKGATLYLTSGNYDMENLRTHRRSVISIDLSGGAITINAVEDLDLGRRTEIEITSGTATGVTINVLNDRMIWMGSHTNFRGTLVAPDSMVWFGYGAELEGAVYAKRIWAGKHFHFRPHDR